MGRVARGPNADVMFVYVWSLYISLGLVIPGNPPLSSPASAFTTVDSLPVSIDIQTRDITNPTADTNPVFTRPRIPPSSMYDIQTLFAVPEGFRSKALTTTLRAFGDKTNVMPSRPSAGKSARADFNPPPRFASRKASATVALTSTTALRTWKPLSTTPLDFSQREENVIPFPSAPTGEQSLPHHTPVVLKRPLPIETRRSRRSGALVPASARAYTPPVVRPVAKRPRKSKRVLADLQFMASVHRSIIALHVETRNSRIVTMDAGVDPMDLEEGHAGGSMAVVGAREELDGLDQQLVARLAQRLRCGGFSSPLMDASLAMKNDQPVELHGPREGTRAPPPSPEMDSGVHAMDITADPLPVSLMSSCVPRTPSVSTMPPPPSRPPPTPLGNSPPPSSPPGLVSPRVPAEVSAEKRIYTMPQLVAAHIMRLHERGSARTPSLHPRAPRSCSPLCEAVVP